MLGIFYEDIDSFNDISNDEDDMNDFSEEPFIYSRENFRNLVKIIPYMLIKRHFFYPCCNKFDFNFLCNFGAPTNVTYFTYYNDKVVIKDANEQFKHLEVNRNIKNTSTTDSVHRFHQIFHIWLSFYTHCKNTMIKAKLTICLVSSF